MPEQHYNGSDRGGEQFLVRRVHVTNKALTQYQEYIVRGHRGQLINAFNGQYVRRLADGSPYFIISNNGLRYVFVVEKEQTIESGRFALVTVTREFSKVDNE